MSDLDLGLVTSVVTFLCLIVFGYFTGEAVGKTEVLGFAGAVAGLIVWYYNEKHNSDLIRGNEISENGEVETATVVDGVETEEDLLNPEYADDCSDEDQGC